MDEEKKIVRLDGLQLSDSEDLQELAEQLKLHLDAMKELRNGKTDFLDTMAKGIIDELRNWGADELIPVRDKLELRKELFDKINEWLDNFESNDEEEIYLILERMEQL